MTDINAAIGIEQLKYLEEDNQKRAKIAHQYKQQLANTAGIELYPYEDMKRSSFHFYPILVENREALLEHFRAHKIYLDVHYKRNDQYEIYQKADLPCTDYIDERTLTLPIHVLLEEKEVQFVIDTLKKGW